MPFQPIIPTWLAWNNANFTSPTGLTDIRTGQPFPAGGLGLGDFFDATEKEANACSALSVGLLHSGRYRLVQVDAGATAADVRTGTVGYVRAGSFVQGVVISAPGTGATPGTYNIPATAGSGGGSGAVVTVVVAADGTLASASVLQGGFNFTSVPAFALTVTGTTGGTVTAQLNTTPNSVTSYDQATAMGTLVRPVVFLNSITPGNYGFIQELGVATLLAGAAAGTALTGDFVDAEAGGVVTTTAGTGSPIGATVGRAIDVAIANQMFKAYLTGPVVQD